MKSETGGEPGPGAGAPTGLRIIVCIKHALDVSEIKVDSRTRSPIVEGVPRKISDFDKNAMEEAIKLREKHGGEVMVLTVAGPESRIAIKEALAMGGDKAFLVTDPSFENLDTSATVFVLARAIQKIGEFDIVLCGEASIDGFSFQVGPRLAELLDTPQVAYVSGLSLKNNTTLEVERSMEEGYQVVEAELPAVVTVTKEINEPRIPSLMDVMKAAKKEITMWKAEDLGISPSELQESSTVQMLEAVAPVVERKRMIIEGEGPEEVGKKMVQILTEEGVV